jgi:Listeria-Bacteroides repeat domain (List_Bact_rpt).
MTTKKILKQFVMVIAILTMALTSIPTEVYAAAKKPQVNVTFNANGGKFAAKTRKGDKVNKARTKVVRKVTKSTKGTKVGTLPRKPIRKGYAFGGYSAKKNSSKKITKNTKVKKNTTFYTIWKANEYTLTFDPNGGTLPSNARTRKRKFNSKYGDLPIPIRAGHKFKGYRTARNGGTTATANTTYTTAANVTLYAQWEEIPAAERLYELRVFASVNSDSGLSARFNAEGAGMYKAGQKVWVSVTPMDFDPLICALQYSVYTYPNERLGFPELGSDFVPNFNVGQAKTGTYIIMPSENAFVKGSYYLPPP